MFPVDLLIRHRATPYDLRKPPTGTRHVLVRTPGMRKGAHRSMDAFPGEPRAQSPRSAFFNASG